MEKFLKKTLETNKYTFNKIENPIILKKMYNLFQTLYKEKSSEKENSSENNIDLECFDSGYFLWYGIYFSIKQNWEQAKYWYERDSELGNAKSMNCLGAYYEEVKNDKEQAKYWFEKAS